MPGHLAAPTQAVTSLGYSWIPYVVTGVALIVMAVAARHRARSRAAASLTEFAITRGIVLVLLATAIGLLADAAAEGDGVTAIDRPIWSWLINHRSGFLTGILKVVTTVGSTVSMGVIAVIAVAVLARRSATRDSATLVAAVAAGAGLIVAITKPIVGRVRPPAEFRLVTETNQSFPSGHAVASIAIIGVLAVVFVPRIPTRSARIAVTVVAAGFVALIGISRLYLGVHWPTDVAGGWLTGAAWLLLCLTLRTLWQTYPIMLRVGRRRVLHHLPTTSEATQPHTERPRKATP